MNAFPIGSLCMNFGHASANSYIRSRYSGRSANVVITIGDSLCAMSRSLTLHQDQYGDRAGDQSAPTKVCSAPSAPMIGPPASIPAALPAFTTTLWPDNNARRSAPADDLVISTEIAAFPTTTVSPANAPITATTTGVVHKPIP